jgi:hypothetical protein
LWFHMSYHWPLLIMLQMNILTWQRHVFQAFSHGSHFTTSFPGCFMLHSFIKFAQNGRQSKSFVHPGAALTLF